jgi:hypothetical protein
MRPPVPLRAAAVYLIAFGALFVGLSAWMWRRELQARSWPAVDARSAGSQVTTYRGKNRMMYRAQYALRYEISGRAYEVPLSASAAHSSEARAVEDARRYEEGTVHRIRYNPAEPVDIRSDAGAQIWLLPALFTAVGAILFAIGCAILVRIRTRPPPRCAACSAAVEPTFRYCTRCGTVRSEARSEMPDDWGAEEEQPWQAQLARTEADEVRRNRTGDRVGGAVFALVGIVLLGLAVSIAYRRYQAARTWPAVEGTVTRARVAWEQGREGQRAFRPNIELRYRVGDSERRSIAAMERSNNYVWARRTLERSPVGARRTVRYDPSAPDVIQLEGPVQVESILAPAILGGLGLVFTPIGLALVARGLAARAAFCARCRRRVLPRCRFCPHCGAPAQAGSEG